MKQVLQKNNLLESNSSIIMLNLALNSLLFNHFNPWTGCFPLLGPFRLEKGHPKSSYPRDVYGVYTWHTDLHATNYTAYSTFLANTMNRSNNFFYNFDLRWSCDFFSNTQMHMSHEKNPLTFQYTGFLIGIRLFNRDPFNGLILIPI